MEPPMSPVPITDARGLSSTGTLFGEVISKAAGALQVDVVQLLDRRLDVHQDPYTAGLHPYDVQLPGAQQRDVTETDLAGGGGREHRMNVVGRREKYGNDVLVLEAVGLDHRLHQGDVRAVTWWESSWSTVVAPRRPGHAGAARA